MNVIVTCGPSFEPIDQVRRITNFSTGRLGIALANAFTEQGWKVFCLKGEQATCPDPVKAHALKTFTTNDDLASQLEAISRNERIDAVLHAAALADFKVEAVKDELGAPLVSSKHSTRSGRLHLVLAPTVKVLPLMRGWFPQARLVGWKYETEGTQAAAFIKARQQLQDCRTDACVLNGPAYGDGFAFCTPGDKVDQCENTPALTKHLIQWLEGESGS